MNQRRELKILRIVTFAFVCLHLLFELWLKQTESYSDETLLLKTQFNSLDSKCTVLEKEISANRSIHIMDSLTNLIYENFDSLGPKRPDSFHYSDVRSYMLHYTEQNIAQKQYRVDSLNYILCQSDKIWDSLGLSEHQKLGHTRDSIRGLIINKYSDVMASLKLQLQFVEFVTLYAYVFLLVLFPGRWLLTYLVRRTKQN